MEPIEIYTDFLDTYYVPGEILFGLGGKAGEILQGSKISFDINFVKTT